jgi:SP family facilitated glucose transporter-like MFS transporter 3
MPSLGEELTLAYLLLSSFTYGFHISSLNAPRSALTCSPHAAPSSSSSLFSLPLCLSISSSEFGYVTAAYTLGGLLILPFLPSLLAKSPDVRRTLRVCAATAAVGSLVQAGSTGVGSLVLGRLLSGIGAAAGISEVPGGLVRVVQASSGTGSRRSVGIFHQVSPSSRVDLAYSIVKS